MVKMRTVITTEDGAELKRLYADLVVATRKASAVLRAAGMESQAFLKADKEVGIIVRRIKEIRGIAGKHWMAI
jgi:hypothetical protein